MTLSRARLLLLPSIADQALVATRCFLRERGVRHVPCVSQHLVGVRGWRHRNDGRGSRCGHIGRGEVIGVIPQRLVDVEVAHHGVTRLEVTANMHERKARMIELAGGFIALPGGFGTYEEVFEVLTWNQLGIISAPVVFLDVGEGSESFWQPMMEFLHGAVAAGLLKERYRAFVHLTSSVDEAVRIATGPAPTAAPKWSDVTKSAGNET